MSATTVTEGRPWLRHLVVLLVLTIALLLAWLLAVTLVPRWWGQTLGNRIDGRITVGTGYGLTIGFLFTFLPLLVARQAFRGLAWKTRGLVLAAAGLLAIPNLLTLVIVLGKGDGAHAGDRILDVDGPGFRTASAFGALGAAAVFALAVSWGVMRRRDRRRVSELAAKVED